MAHIILQRLTENEKCTIGELTVFGETVWTLEDAKREHKVFGETRIPAGKYHLELRNEGGMTQRYAARFPNMHRGMIWLRHVPMFEFIYLHIGNTARDTDGCILVGLGRDENRIVNSRVAYEKIYPPIVEAIEDRGCHIIIKDEE
jgi:hypothetical protein